LQKLGFNILTTISAMKESNGKNSIEKSDQDQDLGLYFLELCSRKVKEELQDYNGDGDDDEEKELFFLLSLKTRFSTFSLPNRSVAAAFLPFHPNLSSTM
jgi:hypothetical protein